MLNFPLPLKKFASSLRPRVSLILLEDYGLAQGNKVCAICGCKGYKASGSVMAVRDDVFGPSWIGGDGCLDYRAELLSSVPREFHSFD